MSIFFRWMAAASLMATVMTCGGCVGGIGASTDERLQPADFQQPRARGNVVAPVRTLPPLMAEPAARVVAPAPSPAADDAPPPAGAQATAAPAAPKDPSGAEAANRQFVVDAMVGQVNGKPIFASEVFRAIGEEVLQRLGQTKPRQAFQQDAMELIANELRARVTNAMILAEAERTLTEQEKLGLLGFLKQQREEVIARYGGGVQALAEQELLRLTGRTLDEELEVRRQKLLSDKFLGEKLRPRIVVTRREVERYYHDKQSEFNPPPSAELRIIVVTNDEAAAKVREALASGASFESVAREYSRYNPGEGGMLKYNGRLAEFKELGIEAINERVRRLGAGEQSAEIELERGAAWVRLEKLQTGDARSLQDVFLEIEARLRSQKFNALSRKQLDELLRNGNYTPVDQMARALLDVAMTRYARPQ